MSIGPYNLSKSEKADLESGDLKNVDSVRLKIKEYCIKNQNRYCCYCKVQLHSENKSIWNLEHVVSKEENPAFKWEPKNLAASCIDCNIYKGTKPVQKKLYKRYPKNPESFRIVHPYLDKWDKHIWIMSSGVYKGLTNIGINTISVCNLLRNQSEAVGLDRVRSNPICRDLIDKMVSSPNDDWIDALKDAVDLIRHREQNPDLS